MNKSSMKFIKRGHIILLNERQRMFAQHYAKHKKILEALSYAGYKVNSYKQGYKLLAKQEIKDYIDKCYEVYNRSSINTQIVSREQIINKCLEIVDGEETRESDKLKGVDIICKIMGYYAPVEVNQNINVSKDLQSARERLIKYVGSNETEGELLLTEGIESDNSMV